MLVKEDHDKVQLTAFRSHDTETEVLVSLNGHVTDIHSGNGIAKLSKHNQHYIDDRPFRHTFDYCETKVPSYEL